MATVYQIYTGTTGAGSGFTVPVSTSPGDAIVITCNSTNTTGAACTDSQGNTYQLVSNNTAQGTCMFSATYNGSPGTPTKALTASTDTITPTATSIGGTAVVVGVRGIAPQAPDASPAYSNGTSGTATGNATGTLSQTGDIIVSAVLGTWATTGAGVSAWGDSLTQVAATASAGNGNAVAWKVAASTASDTPSATMASSEIWIVHTVALTPGWQVLQSAKTAATASSGSSATVTFTTANLSAGSKMVIALGWASGTTQTVTSVKDASGNAFARMTGAPNSGGPSGCDLWELDTPAGDVGTKPVITVLTSGSVTMSLLIQEVYGLATGTTAAAVIDGTAGTKTGSGGSSTGVPTYISSVTNEYLVSVYGDDGGPETLGTVTGLTKDPNVVSANSFADVGIAYGNSTGTTETNGSWALSGTSAEWGMILAAFKLAQPPVALPGASFSDAVPGQAIPGFVPGTAPKPGTTSVSSSDTGSGADAVSSVHASFTSTDASSQTADAGESVHATLSSTDASSLTADAGSYSVEVSSTDASSQTADAGEQVHASFTSTDASSLTADASPYIALANPDASSQTADASSIHASFTSTDASSLTADAGSYSVEVSSTDASSQTADAGEQVHASFISTDASSLTADAGSYTVEVSSADASSLTTEASSIQVSVTATDASSQTVDAGETVHVSSADASGLTTEASSIHASFTATDASSLTADAGETVHFASTDASSLTADSGLISGSAVSSTDASSLTADAGETVHFASTDASSLTADSGLVSGSAVVSADASSLTVDAATQIHVTSADSSSQTADGGESIHVTLSSADASSLTADGGEKIKFTATDASSLTADAAVSIIEGAVSSDSSSQAVDAGETVHVTSSDASSLTADASPHMALASSDASSQTVDAGTLHVTFTATDASSQAVDASSIQASFTSTDASSLTADSGFFTTYLSSADSAHATDLGLSFGGDYGSASENQSVGVAIVSADSGSGSDLVSQVRVVAADASSLTADSGNVGGEDVTSADSGTGTDAGETIHLPSADASSLTADAGSVSTAGHPTSADSGHFQDSEIDYLYSSDTASGADSAAIGPPSADTGSAVDAGSVLITGTIYVTSADSGRGTETWYLAGARSSADSGTGADSGPLYPFAITDTDSGSAAENLWTHPGTDVPQSGIDVWTTIPDNMFLNGGDGLYNVVWHPGRPDEVVVLRGMLTPGLLRFAHEIAQTDSLTLLGDSDAGSGTEQQTPLATVSAVVLAPVVSVGIPGRVGAPGQYAAV